MSPDMWAKMHGATVHFPIALVTASAVLELSARWSSDPSLRHGLNAAGYWTMLLGAAGTVPAVTSGLVMSRGVLLGRDMLRNHHLFAWPSLAMIVGLACWRILSGRRSGRSHPFYLAALLLTSALVLTAGYWGGELALQ